MSGWTAWVDFIVREANAIYMDVQQKYKPAYDPANQATWHIQIGSHDGDIYAHSPNIDYEFEKSALIALSNEAARNPKIDTNIFTEPPKGYAIIKGVDVDDEYSVVVQGKNKIDGNHVMFAYNANTTFIVALVEIQKNNQGATSRALNAFHRACEDAKKEGNGL